MLLHRYSVAMGWCIANLGNVHLNNVLCIHTLSLSTLMILFSCLPFMMSVISQLVDIENTLLVKKKKSYLDKVMHINETTSEQYRCIAYQKDKGGRTSVLMLIVIVKLIHTHQSPESLVNAFLPIETHSHNLFQCNIDRSVPKSQLLNCLHKRELARSKTAPIVSQL